MKEKLKDLNYDFSFNAIPQEVEEIYDASFQRVTSI